MQLGLAEERGLHRAAAVRRRTQLGPVSPTSHPSTHRRAVPAVLAVVEFFNLVRGIARRAHW